MIEPPSDVSVIICAYDSNRWQYLLEAVASVQTQTWAPREIIVVVDYNGALLQRVSTELVSVIAIPNTESVGAAGARNSAARQAQGAIIAFLDDDAVAVPDWLAGMKPWLYDPCILGVGGEIEPLWEQGRPSWFPEEFDWVVGCTYRGVPLTTTPVQRLISANMAMRLSIFEALGGFRPGFGKVGSRSQPEDTELCIRATQRWPDATWLYVPSVKVRHHVPPQRARFVYFLVRCYNEGRGKAEMVDLVGSRDGLQAERPYVRTTLPRGIAQGIWDTVRRGDVSGIWRAGTILTGVTVTGTGYIAGRTGFHRVLRHARIVPPPVYLAMRRHGKRLQRRDRTR